MNRVVVLRDFPRPVSIEELLAMNEAGADCADMYGVTRKESFLSDDRMRLICIYDAPDCEAVRKANDTAGAPYTAVFPALMKQTTA